MLTLRFCRSKILVNMAKGRVEEQPFEPDRPLIDWKKDWPKILMGLSLIGTAFYLVYGLITK